MTVFDPLGLLAPWLLQPRVLVQELWRLRLDWDEPVPDDIMSVWNEWLAELSSVGDIQVPRYVFGDQSTPESYGTRLLRCQ